MEAETFTMPVLGSKPAESYTWEPTMAHRSRALRNHNQTLERLRERGGLGWTELYAVICNKGLFDVLHTPEAKANAREYLVSIALQEPR